ncbi:hypothetical protein HYALB_00006287 [Hymenoscyphus albidus]|uniref:Uncharacterized protein n=1 Tax=Hymenoscyphus albidus TaxID=595503 RepID=A0A9N9M1G7_9HELO|nr:hypothetical protein HYALB_00006287 [Hymenoscyphus albidus]
MSQMGIPNTQSIAGAPNSSTGSPPTSTERKQRKGRDLEILLLIDDDTPFVVFLAVHDVHQPGLDEMCVLPAIAPGHGDSVVYVFVADSADGSNEELSRCQFKRGIILEGRRETHSSPRPKGLNHPPLLNSLNDFLHRESPLYNLQGLQSL